MNIQKFGYFKQSLEQKFYRYVNRLEKEQGINFQDHSISTFASNLEILESHFCPPRYLYHFSYAKNRDKIMAVGLKAFGNACVGVYVNVPSQYNPMNAYGFYPSICGDTFLAREDFDYWQIDTYKLPRFTWFLDPHSPSHHSSWFLTPNNIPPFALRLYKIRYNKNFIHWTYNTEAFMLYPERAINREIEKLRKERIQIYF